MNRLIDMMTDVELSSKVLELFSGSACLEKGWKRTSDLKQGLEALFEPIPHWSDNLALLDNQTWVLCFISDDSPQETRHVDWVTNVNDHGYASDFASWKYATPVDLDLRYSSGESDG